jgi:hypothetical protein
MKAESSSLAHGPWLGMFEMELHGVDIYNPVGGQLF